MSLKGLRLGKVWKARNAYVFEVTGPKKYLITRPGGFYLANYAPRGGADGFAMFLRKHVRGKIIQDVRQHNIDRIIFIDLGDSELVFELFGKGNIILLEDGRVTGLLHRSKKFNKGGEYSPPESVHYLSLTSEEFSSLVEDKDKAEVARTLGIGGLVEDAWGEDMQAFLKKLADDPLDPEEIEERFKEEDLKSMKEEAEDELGSERKKLEKSIEELKKTMKEYEKKAINYRSAAETLMGERQKYQELIDGAYENGKKRIKVTLLDK